MVARGFMTACRVPEYHSFAGICSRGLQRNFEAPYPLREGSEWAFDARARGHFVLSSDRIPGP